MPPIDALQNAARLRNSPSTANMANYDDIFNPHITPGQTPTAWAQQSGDANMERAATTLGGGAAFRGLQRAAESQKLAGIQDEIDTDANLKTGRPERIATMQAGIGNRLGDINSEATARRSMLPHATDLRAQMMDDTLTKSNAQFGEPARIRADGDAQSALITARGRMEAANAGQSSLPMKALLNAMSELQEKKGQPASPQEIQGLEQMYGVQLPRLPNAGPGIAPMPGPAQGLPDPMAALRQTRAPGGW